MIVLAATPLGNPGDATDRLREALATADVIAAEDTRRLRRLASSLQVTLTAPVVSFYDAVEADRVQRLLREAAAGATVVVLSDAGTPVVSDPGFRLVAAAAESGVPVTVLPGPSAVTAALAVSGLPSDRFCFEGFLPRRTGDRRRALAELAAEPRTMVFFESPRRVAQTLADMAEVLGSDRAAVLCRELTKTHEEIVRGTVAQLVERAASGVLGEVTLVVAGAPRAAPVQVAPSQLAAQVAEHERAGLPRKEAMSLVAREARVPRRAVYDAVVAAKSR